MKQQMGRALRRAGAGEQIVISAALADRAVQGCVRLLLTAALAGAVVLGEAAPFAAAMTAASGAGFLGGCAVVGACLGALCQLELTLGLRYASAAMLIYAAAFALYDVKLLRRSWTMPLVAGAAMAFTGLAAHARFPWTGEERLILAAEVALTVGAAWCFRAALRPVGREGPDTAQRRGGLVLLAAVLAALVPVEGISLSLGRALGGVPVLWAAFLGGGSTGAAWGAVLGLGADLAGPGDMLRAMVWPLAGLAAGSFRKKGRLSAVLPWLGASVACALLWQERDAALICAGESILSALLFIVLPKGWMAKGEVLFHSERGKTADPGGVGEVRRQLERTAKAYRTLCHTLKESLSPPDNDGDVALVFDRAAGRVCRSCANQTLCWQKDYGTTFNALNDATAPMVERGRALGEDFPAHFANRCIKLPDFLAAVNEELTALFYRRQYRARVMEGREAVCQQYDQLSSLLEAAALELGEELIPDPERSRALRRHLSQRNLRGEGSVFRDSRGLLRVRLRGPDCAALGGEDGAARLSRLLGRPMRVQEAGDGELSLVELEPYKAVAGVALRKKDGETVSGDAGTYFKRNDGKVYLLLCDGMGSGEQASRESGLAIRLLEQFLQTGISADHALLTLISALALRGEETGGFTTVDLLELDLFTGEGYLYKLGAAPTYVRQGDCIRRLAGESLPAGLAAGDEQSVDRFSLKLTPGDCVLMASDGVCGTGEDGWLMERLRDFDGVSPRKLAARLITDSPQGATDDRTALVVMFEKR